LVEQGTHDEVILKDGLYSVLVATQQAASKKGGTETQPAVSSSTGQQNQRAPAGMIFPRQCSSTKGLDIFGSLTEVAPTELPTK
jgi:hypothetical protein